MRDATAAKDTALPFIVIRIFRSWRSSCRAKPVAEQEIGKLLLLETVSYAESSMCRRKTLLHYFGEEYPEENCG